jgi:hypothetical protein
MIAVKLLPVIILLQARSISGQHGRVVLDILASDWQNGAINIVGQPCSLNCFVMLKYGD